MVKKSRVAIFTIEKDELNGKIKGLYEIEFRTAIERLISVCKNLFNEIDVVYNDENVKKALKEYKDINFIKKDKLNDAIKRYSLEKIIFLDANMPFIDIRDLEKIKTYDEDKIYKVIIKNKGVKLPILGACGEELCKCGLKDIKSTYDAIDELNCKEVGVVCESEMSGIKIDNSKDNMEANILINKRNINQHINGGVFFISKDGIVITSEVEIGAGTTILPGTILKGKTKIGKHCTVGPNSLIEDSQIQDNSVVNASQVYKSIVKQEVKIGPFCHIRPDSVIENSVKIGDFVEIKNSNIGAGTSVSHLTYIGDSDIGKNVNFGCGVVTVNYDGVNKNRCRVKDGAFIGCNTNLIAPVTVEENGYTAAGSTITKDIKKDELGIERAKQKNIVGYSKSKLKGRKLKIKE